jgi:hypothetical protein
MLTLEEERKSVVEAVTAHGFNIFWGAPHPFHGPTLYWNRHHKPDVESFLSLARASSVETVFVDWDDLRDRDLEWLRSLVHSPYGAESGIDVELLVQHLGRTGRITLGYFRDGVCHLYERMTPWFVVLLRLEESTREQGPPR